MHAIFGEAGTRGPEEAGYLLHNNNSGLQPHDRGPSHRRRAGAGR